MADLIDDLPPKQREFVLAYLDPVVGWNATEAARRAGYRHPDVQGPRLLHNVRIAAAIAVVRAQRARSADIEAVRVLRELATIAFADLGDLFEITPQGLRLLPEKFSDPNLSRAIAAIKVRRELRDGAPPAEVVEFRLWPKVEALKTLAQHLGLLKEKVEHTGKDGGPVEHVHIYIPANGRT